MTDLDDISESERKLIGSVTEGVIEAVFRWGVIVDLGLSRVGLIDALYIDEASHYLPGELVRCHLDDFDEMKGKFILRPMGQIPLMERLRDAGYRPGG
ncbi:MULTISPECIES: hypothetical protein [unclassified Streptomyces]|uniref:hypothetical protein n=1 Tax=unclassified Streptomyces TaxID=2593676 RepID=UPI002E373071|nr:hypothetical protein [Streptomyces sp. NBC_01268]